MKRIKYFAFLVLIFCFSLVLSSCNLLGLGDDAIYFYSMGMEWEEAIDYELKYSANGYTFIMSRGDGENVLTQEQAETLKTNTVFDLSLHQETEVLENAISPESGKTVDELDNGWHVVQEFTMDAVSKGTYKLIGKTDDDESEFKRENLVNLTIK